MASPPVDSGDSISYQAQSDDASWFLWAKWPAKRDGLQPYHPLPCHMLDTACVVESLWQSCLPKRWQQQLADDLHLDALAAQQWLMLLAGLHDVGKASPGFQTQLLGESLTTVQALLRKAAMPTQQQRWVPHALVSAKALGDYYDQHQSDNDDVIMATLMMIGGHHGTFPSRQVLLEPASLSATGVGKGPWVKLRHRLIEWLAATLNVSPHLLPQWLPRPTALRIAGVISVADWIASSATDFSFAVADATNPQPMPAATYLQRARRQTQSALARIGWLGWNAPTTPATFAMLFPGKDPRDLQQAVMDIAPEIPSPAMVVIEAPMGEGKTEAAMYLADQWTVADGGRGIFFALPTQATSTSMFLRVRDFLRQRYPADFVNLNLLHGHAALSEALEELREEGNKRGAWLLDAQAIYDQEKADDGAKGAVIATEWFASGKRALLAPFGVGTIDQGLLTALSVKHGFVRHLGLSTKTVIIDEVHAYDVYMTTLLARLLEWLGAHAVPVVLLSATLPATRRERLLAAYAKGSGWSAPTKNTLAVAYPRVSWVTAAGIGQRTIPIKANTMVQLVHLERTPSPQANAQDDADVQDANKLGPLLEEALREGGCVAVICNTVNRAQQIFQTLRTFFPDPATTSIDLFHARFPYEMRAAIEERVLRLFGKTGPRPEQAILVATQVIEQSLDLDFDLMVTDLAPVDLVLQRMGRLHRHARPSEVEKLGPRPLSLQTPRCYLFMPPKQGACPAFTKADTYIYDAHTLLRSWLELREKAKLTIPRDIESLVEAVYREEDAPAEMDPALRQLWATTYDDLLAAERKESAMARDRLIRDPGASVHLDELMRTTLEEDSPEIHRARQALTRNTRPSVNVICLSGTCEQPRLQPEGDVFDLQKYPDPETIRNLLLRSVTLSQYDVVEALKDARQPEKWQQVALLRHYRPLFFDAESKVTVGKHLLRLDPYLGIVIQRNGATN